MYVSPSNPCPRPHPPNATQFIYHSWFVCCPSPTTVHQQYNSKAIFQQTKLFCCLCNFCEFIPNEMKYTKLGGIYVTHTIRNAYEYSPQGRPTIHQWTTRTRRIFIRIGDKNAGCNLNTNPPTIKKWRWQHTPRTRSAAFNFIFIINMRFWNILPL